MQERDEELSWEEKTKWVSYFVKRLQFSGYDKRFRHRVVTAALKKYDKRKEEYERTGTMFRNYLNKKRRRSEKERKNGMQGVEGMRALCLLSQHQVEN